MTSTGVPVSVVRSSGVSHLVTTPCGDIRWVTGGQPVGAVQVVIDPGHGGPIDTGAVGANGLAEKVVNLRVAETVTRLLNQWGIATILTRTADYAVPLSVRAVFADTLGADLMVSIHHNAPSAGPSEGPGTEVFVQSNSTDSQRLGGLLFEEATSDLAVFKVPWVRAADAGVMTVISTRGRDAYGIIRGPSTPTALIELGYISNPSEARLFERPIYTWVAANAVARAIDDYLNTDRPGSGYVEGRVFNPRPGVGKSVCTNPELTPSTKGAPRTWWRASPAPS